METPLGSYEKEYMKMAMLKHEQTFKQQVYELHRLYRIQKILMKSIGSSSVHVFAGNNNNNNNNAEEFVEAGTDAINEEEEEKQVELTLGLGLGTNNNKRKKLGGSNSGSSSFSTISSSTGSSTTRSSFYQYSDTPQQFNKFPNDDVEAAGDRETLHQYPPWIFQVLTLNST